MSRKLIVLFLCLGMPLFSFGYRAWQSVDTGAEISGIGEAVSVATGSSLSMDMQPASTGLHHSPLLTWSLSASLSLRDPLSGSYSITPDPLPFLGFGLPLKNIGIGVFLRRNITSPLSDLSVSSAGISVARSIFPSFRVGMSLGPILATEHQKNSFGWYFSGGILWQIFSSLKVGLSYQRFSELHWPNSIYGREVREQFPPRLRIGAAFTTDTGEYFFQVGYTDIQGGWFERDDFRETIPFSYERPWSFHSGWRGKLPWWNIPFHLGLVSDNLWLLPSPLRQWSLAIGVTAEGKNTRITLTWMDSYLFSLLDRNIRPVERGLISFSYVF